MKKDGTWIETHPSPNTVMVNIGDVMQRWTSDKFISTVSIIKTWIYNITVETTTTVQQKSYKVLLTQK